MVFRRPEGFIARKPKVCHVSKANREYPLWVVVCPLDEKTRETTRLIRRFR